MTGKIKKDTRNALLAVLFVKAQNHGIEPDELREDITFAVIGKRISDASIKEIVRLIEHVTGLYRTLPSVPSRQGRGSQEPAAVGNESFKRYPSSRAGLLEELTDVAIARWGAEFEKPLNAFINSHRGVNTHYRFLDITALKAVKERIREMNQKGEE